jgi:hypothetical protein
VDEGEGGMSQTLAFLGDFGEALEFIFEGRT